MDTLRSSDDYKDLLSAFNDANVRYLIVGGFAIAVYSRPRYTKDFEIWVDPSGDNPERVFEALARFGAPVEGMSPDDFRDPDCVFQIGVEPMRIDILNDIAGPVFEDAWPKRFASHLGGVPTFVIARADLIANKRAAGRPSDLRHVAALEEDE